MAEKKIRQWVTRVSDALDEAAQRFADERGLSPAEVVRRAVQAFIAPAPTTDDKPGAIMKPRGVEVSSTEELGPDSLGAPTRSLAR